MARCVSQGTREANSVTRRQFGSIVGATAVAAFLGGKGKAAAAPLPKLPNLTESEALLLLPSDLRYPSYQLAYNKRTILKPALRAVCRTYRAVATLVDWASSHDLRFAI